MLDCSSARGTYTNVSVCVSHLFLNALTCMKKDHAMQVDFELAEN